jgi:YfiH family protein
VTLELRRSSLLNRVAGVAHAFTTRRGGVSDGPFAELNLSARVGDKRGSIDANRKRLLLELGRPSSTLVTLRQVHGADVVEVTRLASRVIEADALWTRDREAVLGVLVADCVPILLASGDGQAVAAVHAGWRGTAARIAALTVARLAASGFPAASLTAAIGPAIGPCCFEIGAEVEDELRRAYPSAGDAVRVSPDGKRVADLWALNQQALLEAGVPAASIDIISECTACHPDLYFSHRRDQGHSGRQAGVIAPAVGVRQA